MSDHYETRCPSCGGSDEQGCYADCPTHHITALEARVRELEEALRAATGYMTNAAIDLDTGAPKKTALATINGGIKLARAALNQEKQK